MLIESIIRRSNAKKATVGTTVTFGAPPNVRAYKFEPTATDPRHVCEVEDEDDIQALLAIREGYRIAKGSTKAGAQAPQQPPQPQKPPAAPPQKPPAAPPQK